jgi:hypothetical protein
MISGRVTLHTIISYSARSCITNACVMISGRVTLHTIISYRVICAMVYM